MHLKSLTIRGVLCIPSDMLGNIRHPPFWLLDSRGPGSMSHVSPDRRFQSKGPLSTIHPLRHHLSTTPRLGERWNQCLLERGDPVNRLLVRIRSTQERQSIPAVHVYQYPVPSSERRSCHILVGVAVTLTRSPNHSINNYPLLWFVATRCCLRYVGCLY